MLNPLLPQRAKITDVRLEAPQVKVLTLKPRKEMIFEAGQFLELSLPGVGEAPFAFCSSQYNSNEFQIAVQEKGVVTSALFHKNQDSYVGVRGPYGRGFPLEKLIHKNLVIIAGGIGLAPLRSVILSILHHRSIYKKVQLLYGTKCEEHRIFEKEFPSWQKQGIDVKVTLDQCQPQWKGNIELLPPY